LIFGVTVIGVDEDLSRARSDNAPLNLEVLCRIALNISRSNHKSGPIRSSLNAPEEDNRIHAGLLAQIRYPVCRRWPGNKSQKLYISFIYPRLDSAFVRYSGQAFP